MKLFATHRPYTVQLIITIALGTSIVGHLFFMPKEGHTEQSVPTQPALYSFPASTTVPVRVSGIVEAVDTVLVRAQVGGTLTTLQVTEGTPVTQGALLSQIDAPVISSEIALQDAYGTLSVVAKEAQQSAQEYQTEKTKYLTEDSSVQNTLRKVNDENRIQDNARLVLTNLQASILTLVAGLDFIDTNRTLFPKESIDSYRNIVASLYEDNEPSFLSNGIRYNIHSENESIALLKSLQTQEPVDVNSVFELSALIDSDLTALQQVFTSAETRFFDERRLATDMSVYAQYLDHRSNTATSQNVLQTSVNALRASHDTGTTNTQTLDTSLALALIDEQASLTQTEYAENLTKQQLIVANAQSGVARAQYSLTKSHAPFSGVISEVFVEQGEYVAPGTPLYTIVGKGVREVKTTIPLDYLPLLAEGELFVMNDTPAGVVRHFAPLAVKGSVEVFIELTSPLFVIGDVVRGELLLQSTNTNVTMVPRSHLSFDSHGAYITYESGDRSYFQILHDIGDFVYGTPETVHTMPLLASSGSNL